VLNRDKRNKMIGFLQGFYGDAILAETDEMEVVRCAAQKAIEIAMMGLADEANNLLTLAKVKETNRTISVLFTSQLEFFLAESRACGSDGLDEQGLRELEVTAKGYLPHLPEGITFDDVTQESYANLNKFAKEMEESGYSKATTGADV